MFGAKGERICKKRKVKMRWGYEEMITDFPVKQNTRFIG